MRSEKSSSLLAEQGKRSSSLTVMPDSGHKKLKTFAEGIIDAWEAQRDAERQAQVAAETEARAKALEVTATLDARYAGFRVVTAHESELLQWAKMQVEIRRLQYESGRILTQLTGFVDSDPPDVKKML